MIRPKVQKPRIRYLVFEATSICNLDCRYCYNIWKRPGVEFEHFNSYRLALRTLRHIFGASAVEHVTMTGGEPLLCERFEELVLFCRMRGAGVTVITNGNAADRGRYRLLLDVGVGLFELPLHSSGPHVHDRLTRRPGSWRRSVRSIEDILSLGGAAVASVIVTRANLGHIAGTLRFAAALGVRRIMLGRFNVGGTGIAEASSLAPSVDQLRRVYRAADAVASELALSVTSNVCTPFCVLAPQDYPAIRFSACHPGLADRAFTLDARGNMRFCNHSPIVMGNIHEEHVRDILSSPYLEAWRNTVPDYCKNCTIFDRCFGGCRAASEQLGLTLRRADPLVTGMGAAPASSGPFLQESPPAL